MPSHDYTARQALDVLLARLGERDQRLQAEVISAINAGKDVEERDLRGRRKKPRMYRRTIRFTDEEALGVALSVLEAHFIEQPLFVNSAADSFLPTALGNADRRDSVVWRDEKQSRPLPVQGSDHEKSLEIEMETETTQIPAMGHPTLRLDRVPDGLVDSQQENLKRLADLFSFGP